jgi:hypothetical protein
MGRMREVQSILELFFEVAFCNHPIVSHAVHWCKISPLPTFRFQYNTKRLDTTSTPPQIVVAYIQEVILPRVAVSGFSGRNKQYHSK